MTSDPGTLNGLAVTKPISEGSRLRLDAPALAPGIEAARLIASAFVL